MAKRISVYFCIIEWVLLVMLGVLTITIVEPFSDMMDLRKAISEAKDEGTYTDGNGESQTYFGRKLHLDGIVYDGQEMYVYMTSKSFGSGEQLPNQINVTTDSGETFTGWSGGSSNNVFRAKGYYRLKDMPAGIQAVTVHKDAYGEAFSFQVELSRRNVS